MPARPKPKFRVGQYVVASSYGCVQIKGRCKTSAGFCYHFSSGGGERTLLEKFLRPLTKRERGPEPTGRKAALK